MRKALRWILVTLAGLLVAVLVAACIILSPKTLTRIANKYAADYVDGTARIGRVDIDILKTLPDISVSIDSISVTYPHDAFAAYDDPPQKQAGQETSLLEAGRGQEADTLITLQHLSASINPFKFLNKKIIRIPEARLSGLRAFAHIYNDSTANWSIIKLPESQDTTETTIPAIEAGNISISGIETLVLTSPADTLYARADFTNLDLSGTFALKDAIISTDAALSINGDAHFRNGFLGAIDAPVSISTEADISIAPEGAGINLKALKAQIAALPLEAAGEFKLLSDSTFVNATATIADCPVGDLIDEYGRFLPATARDLKTDAHATVKMQADGWFGSASGILPLLKAEISVPDSHIAYEGLVDDGDFDLTLIAETDEQGRLNADLEDLCFDIQGVSLNMSGKGSDLLGKDPRFGVKASACTEFADLVKYLPPESGISAEGDVDFEVEGNVSLSQLSLQNIHESDLRGHIFSEGFRVSMPSSGMHAYALRPDFKLSTEGQKITLNADIDSVRFLAGKDTYIMGSGLELAANNNGRIMSEEGKIQPLFADLDIDSFNMRGTDDLTVGIRNSCNQLTLGSIAEDGTVRSNVSVKSSNRMAYMHAGNNRVTLADPVASASLQKRTSVRRQRGQRSEMRAPRDSTARRRFADDSQRRPERSIPDYLKEIDFRKKDLSIDIGGSLNELFRKWTPTAEVSFSLGTVATPLLPLRNSITSFDGRFNGDKLELDNFLINSGTTTIGFRGTVSGLEPVLLGHKNAPLNAIVTIHSRMLNLNEILAALEAGSKLAPSAAGQDEYVIEGLDTAEETLDYTALIVPSNLNANLTVDIDSVRYSKLALREFTSRVRMRERCVQLTNTSAGSEFGDVSVDGFYSTIAKDDIKAGFNVNLSSITADRIITLIPAVDSLVPMLKSFKGSLNCEMAATTQLDTNMNILIPSISGAVKLSGSGLELSDTGDLRRIAQILRFKDTKVGHIDDMSVSGIVADNQLEVFPFILGVDRYTLGLSGLQGFDQHFKYHISVIKSPLPFKFGINLKGTFDDWNFSLGRPKYKSTSIPLFSPQVDTLQVNLAASIKDIFRKGVDAAVREYAQERLRVNARRDEFGLFEDDEDEELTMEEMNEIDSYLLDLECEAESEAIEKEIEEMMNEEMALFISDITKK